MLGKSFGVGLTSPLPGGETHGFAPPSGAPPGTTVNVPAAASAGAGKVNYESVRITSASDISASQPGEYLVGLFLEGGATAGWLAFLYDGVSSGILPCPASGLDATGAIGPANIVFYPMNIPVQGTLALKGTSQTFGGGLAAVRAILSNRPNPDPTAITSWSRVRGVAVSGNESGTSGTAKTYTMPGGLSLSPYGAVAMMAIQAGTATGIPSAEIDFPVLPPFANAGVIPATLGRRYEVPRVFPVPSIGPATSFSLTHKAISLGAATDVQIAGVLYV